MTVLDLIKRAYRLIGVYTIGETPSADESADALTALNAMLDSWANERLMIYNQSLDSIALIAGTASYTIGPTGTTVSVRPVSVSDSSYLVLSGVSHPLDVISLQEYNDISLKTAQGIPTKLNYEPSFADGTVKLFPVPNTAMTLNLYSWKAITGFSTITDTVSLPPGYQDAIVYNLAVALAPENETPVPNVVMNRAAMGKRMLKRANKQVPQLEFEHGVPGIGNYGFIQ